MVKPRDLGPYLGVRAQEEVPREPRATFHPRSPFKFGVCTVALGIYVLTGVLNEWARAGHGWVGLAHCTAATPLPPRGAELAWPRTGDSGQGLLTGVGFLSEMIKKKNILEGGSCDNCTTSNIY